MTVLTLFSKNESSLENCQIKMFEDYAFRVALSVSYICLFLVLTVFKYEVMFSIGVILVAAVGFFFPIFYFLPCMFVAWRVLVGLNVATDQKLYIAKYVGKDIDKADLEDSSGSNTLNHWAVVIQDDSEYFYSHAVGKVVSGEGKKIPFREMEDSKLHEYRLNHVGFVTRKQRERRTKEELVDAEEMRSGNSCQEYAVDIAFQLSSSRTYTFVKMMALPRMRNAVFYIALSVSVVFMVLNYPWAHIVNPLFLTNMFAALELSRIGVHNQTQKVHLQYVMDVMRAYAIYPTKGNFLHSFWFARPLRTFINGSALKTVL